MLYLARRFVAPALAMLLAEGRVEAQSAAPILRIEAGMHTTTVERISADATGRLVLTVSSDKTARLWEQPSGRLLRVLRPPLGEGNEGKLFAGALSQDGALAAVGGWTGYEWDKSVSVCLFDTATGRMVRRFSGLPNTNYGLAFSAQGRFLAAVGGGWGLRMWETASGREVGRDTDDGEGGTYGVHWHAEERLVTASYDGYLRLYRLSGGKLLLHKKSKVKGGQEPFSARFSPDGRRIAVGFADSTKVAVVDGSDLSFLYAPDTAGVENGNLCKVTWTDDGTTLAAGGTWFHNGGVSLCRWPESGRGRPRDTVEAGNTITDLWPLPGRRILVGSADPAWNVVQPPELEGEPAPPLAPPPIAEYRNLHENFRLSQDGTTVAFGYTWPPDSTPARFSLTAREVTFLKDAASPSNLLPPRIDGLRITDWNDHSAPKLAGKPLVLSRSEYSQCLAVARDASSFLLAGTWYLRRFTVEGRENWRVAGPGIPQAVNLVDHDQIAVAAYSDGTIRWHSYDDGKELLAFFPHADRKRWVVWAQNLERKELLEVDSKQLDKDLSAAIAQMQSPRLVSLNGRRASFQELDQYLTSILLTALPGDKLTYVLADRQQERSFTFTLRPRVGWAPTAVYYDCSPGGEDLIGWHVNSGKNQAADFFPASRFRSVFYRPDVIQRVLQSRDVAEALRQANAALGRANDPTATIAHVVAELSPPVVELSTGGAQREITLASNQQTFDLGYRVRQTGRQAATQVQVRANGRPLPLAAPAPRGDGEVRVSVPIPPWFEGEVSVIASHALASSEAATLRVRRAASLPPAPKPRLFVISVGAARLAMNQSLLLAANSNPLQSKDRFQDLEFAAEDAKKIAAVLAAQQGKSFSQVEETVLLNEEATAPALRQAIQNVAARAELGDLVLFFFSGHGNHDPKNGKFHLVTHDTDPNREAETAFSGEELSQLLGVVRGYVVVALDACHSGSLLGMQRGQKYKAPPLDISGLANQLSSAEHGIVMLSSSTPDQISFEDRELGGGLFTKSLLEGLAGKAADKDGLISCQGLMRWIDRRVPELAGTEVSQNPVTVMPKGVPDFVISRP